MHKLKNCWRIARNSVWILWHRGLLVRAGYWFGVYPQESRPQDERMTPFYCSKCGHRGLIRNLRLNVYLCRACRSEFDPPLK